MLNWIQTIVNFDLTQDQPPPLDPDLQRVLRGTLRDCKKLYADVAQRYILELPQRLSVSPEQFAEQLDDLHSGVLLKTLIDIAHCDRRWTTGERCVARQGLKHVWGVQVSPEAMEESLQQVVAHTNMLKWSELLRPIVGLPTHADELNRLRVIVLRLANLVAKADGDVSAQELRQLEAIRREFESASQPPASSVSGAGKLQVDQQMTRT